MHPFCTFADELFYVSCPLQEHSLETDRHIQAGFLSGLGFLSLT